MSKRSIGKFVRRAEKKVDYWVEVAITDFVEEIAGRIDSQADLARKLRASSAYVSRVLSGSENLSLRTMAKIALATGGKVRVHVANLDARTVWKDVYSNHSFEVLKISGLRTEPAQFAYRGDDSPVRQIAIGDA